MAEHSAQERTEDATPKRRQQARRKGTVARSNDLTGAVVTLALILAFPAVLGRLGEGFIQSVGALRGVPTDIHASTIGRAVWTMLAPTLGGLALLMGVAMTVGVAANYAQVGFVFSGEAMAPSVAKLNPMQGLKRLFSLAGTFEGIKALAKTLLFGWIAWSAIQGSWPSLVGLAWMTPLGALSALGGVLRAILLKIAFAWLVLAAVDYFFQRKRVDRDLRMTKQEVRQEFKEAETSPELKSQIMQRRRRLLKGRMMDAVRTADVVVTNPTHFAVAISYDQRKNHAPIVVAKGQDLLAARIREIAEEHRVPLVPNPPLARALYKKCEIGDFVPRELFAAVAEVLAYVYKTIKNVRS